MQFHVPFGLATASPTTVAASPSVVGSSNSSPGTSTPTVPTTTSGVAVGQGLLSGRRLAVRLAAPDTPFPPLAPPPPPHPHQEAAPLLAHPAAHTQPSASHAVYGSSSPPPVSGAHVAAASNGVRYGGGIVRISDLQRRGVAAVESGLRLPTLDGGRPAATLAATGTSSGRRRPRDSGQPDADDDTPFTDVYGSSRSGRGGRGRGRGGGRRTIRGSGRASRGSVEVNLNENGELCEHRWFMAGGRRCFVYDGRTYKGSAAHKMWTKVKAIAKGVQRQSERAPTTTSAGATGTGTSLVAAGVAAALARRRHAETPSHAPHRTSARALSATQRSLHQESGTIKYDRNASRTMRAHAASAHNGSSESSGLRADEDEQWRQLAESLDIPLDDYLDDSTTLQPTSAQRREGENVRRRTPVAPTLSQTSVPSRSRAADTAGSASQAVVEVSDSSSDASTSDSDSDDTSTDSSDEAEEENVPASSAQELKWPTTSYFSDDSASWSSSSSAFGEPAPPSTTDGQPARKAAKTETAVPPADAAPATARVQVYNGVQVVEEDGWLYPVDVYASQQQQQQQQQKQPENDTVTLQGVDDVPLARLYAQPPPTAKGLDTKRDCKEALLRGVLPVSVSSSSASLPPPHSAAQPPTSGIAVVLGGNKEAVPLRPASEAKAPIPDALQKSAVLREADDDFLDAFGISELDDMFVTGEEVGGVRYGG